MVKLGVRCLSFFTGHGVLLLLYSTVNSNQNYIWYYCCSWGSQAGSGIRGTDGEIAMLDDGQILGRLASFRHIGIWSRLHLHQWASLAKVSVEVLRGRRRNHGQSGRIYAGDCERRPQRYRVLSVHWKRRHRNEAFLSSQRHRYAEKKIALWQRLPSFGSSQGFIQAPFVGNYPQTSEIISTSQKSVWRPFEFWLLTHVQMLYVHHTSEKIQKIATYTAKSFKLLEGFASRTPNLRVGRALGSYMGIGVGWSGLGRKTTTFCELGWVQLWLVVQTGGEKSQILIAILFIAFYQCLIVNPVWDTKHKYISCFRSTHTYY